jgi:hypothetical protein
MKMERLERIKSQYASENDIDWLIEQAEKVEVLEKRLKELVQTSYCIICGDTATEVRQGRFYCQECCN